MSAPLITSLEMNAVRREIEERADAEASHMWKTLAPHPMVLTDASDAARLAADMVSHQITGVRLHDRDETERVYLQMIYVSKFAATITEHYAARHLTMRVEELDERERLDAKPHSV